MRALLVVDVQRDFLKGGALEAKGTEDLIPVLNRLFDRFELVVACKDWHPKGHLSFASVHGKAVGERVQIGEQEQILWPDHCVQGSVGSEFGEGLHAERFKEVIYKGVDPVIDSYSAFFDNARARSTGLENILLDNAVHELYVCGLTTEYCVAYTVLDALSLGFKTFVITDAVRPVERNRGDSERALHDMQNAGAKLVNSQALL